MSTRRIGVLLPILLATCLVFQGVTAQAQEAGSIAGTAIVTGTDYVVRIQVHDTEGNVVAETTSDGKGTYVVGGLPPGVYHVKFDDAVYGSFPRYWYGTSTRYRPHGLPIVVESGATTPGIDYTYTAIGHGWIEGRAYDAATGAPALVAVEIGTGSGRTQLDGTYRRRTDVGSYTVRFFDNWMFLYADQWWDRAGDATGADIVDVGERQVVRVDGALVPRCQGVEGPHSVGLVDPTSGLWHLIDCEDATMASFYYGNPGDVPFMGDWDCDGFDTPGLFRTSDAFAYLRNSNTQGIADIRFFFGNPSDIPLAGDFNGDGCDTLSIYRPSEARFYIINELGENEGGLGAAEYSFLFGNMGDKPVVGDWDGDGIDEIGLHRESTGFFYYRNTLTTGIADGQFYFGDPGDRFVSGDWGIIDGVDTPAVFRPSNTTFYFRHTLTQGYADSQFVFGESGWLPVAGRYGL
jgi:hypothetical protein